ncbi:MAG: hypothetical protein LBI85_05700 [Spirochaetaceae bacterium]|jgi:NCAIR mutase (PurE)-related protein|nr:hypothetical protein [Spirochaetaceae bacterium]
MTGHEEFSDDLGFAFIDSGRQRRTGCPEVVYCQGKTVEQAEAIIIRMREKGIPVLGTRALPELAGRIGSPAQRGIFWQQNKTCL